MIIKDIKEKILEVEIEVENEDNESAHMLQDELLQEFILFLVKTNESELCVTKIKNYAKEISMVFDVEFNRYYG